MFHRNAPLTPEGRRRLCERVDAGRPICHVATEAGIARQTLGRWHARWREEHEAGLEDRSSRPHVSPNQTHPEVEARVCALRREHKVGPVQLVGKLAEEDIELPASTIYRILVRHGISRLRDLDVTGEDLREPVVRYEWARPGDLVHVDVKKIGRIPDGGGWRVHGRGSTQHKATGRAKSAGARAGYVYLHSAVDDHSRLAYTEELLDEKGASAAGFWERAVKFFRRHGITRIRRVLTDNGSCYRSLLFNAALTKSRSKHKWTRPYRPQTNGKVERYQRTLAAEWARQRAWSSNAERAAALPDFLDRYNYARPHTALKGRPPASRLPAGVTNLAA
ncbi:MAG: IS481 family transposase [Nocardioidaceae bacterium]